MHCLNLNEREREEISREKSARHAGRKRDRCGPSYVTSPSRRNRRSRRHRGARRSCSSRWGRRRCRRARWWTEWAASGSAQGRSRPPLWDSLFGREGTREVIRTRKKFDGLGEWRPRGIRYIKFKCFTHKGVASSSSDTRL